MSEQGLFLQNIIVIIWDFDRTLSPHNMQRPIFEEYGIDERHFWAEVNALPAYYKRAGIHVQEDTCYLGHLLSYVQHGCMPGLSNAKLKELGGRIQLFPGLPECFARLKDVLNAPEFQGGDLHLEHYIVSTGLEAMIRGTELARHVDGVWASEFIEKPAEPDQDLDGEPTSGTISQIATFLDNTTKTRAIFEINKGVNKVDHISVNDTIPNERRRVPFKNMIYVADGPSDIPSFSVVRKYDGLAYAVYNPDVPAHRAQAIELDEANRVNSHGPADYRENSQTEGWLRYHIERIARDIMKSREETTKSAVRPAPRHG